MKRIEAAVDALTNGEKRLDVKLVQMVRLFRAGEPVKMSKRTGQAITLNELIEEVRKKYPQFDTTKTLYCLRHFWITIRILAGMNVYDIAKIAGTSLTQIQKHYDAASSLVTSKKMNKNKIVFDGHGQVVIERQEEGE